jgi:hypothetical protein
MPSRGSGRSVSLWMVTAHGIEPPRLTDEQNADVRIVGAGIATAPLNDTPWELRFLREAGGVAMGPAVEPLAPAKLPERTR